MSTSKISNKNVIMASFDDVPEEVRKAFKERKKARGGEGDARASCMLRERSS
jgi:hypothetical protein